MEKDKAEGPLDHEPGRRLPATPLELRSELLRRLELAEREVRALSAALSNEASDPLFLESIEALRSIEIALQRRLTGDPQLVAQPQQRAEIIALWKKHRRAFEKLAAKHKQRFPARPGSRRMGPRW